MNDYSKLKHVQWVDGEGRKHSPILHDYTRRDPFALRNWAAWNGYDLDADPANLKPQGK